MFNTFTMGNPFLPRLAPNGSAFLLVFERPIVQYKMPDLHPSTTHCCIFAELGGELSPNTTQNSFIYTALRFSLFTFHDQKFRNVHLLMLHYI